MNVSVVRLFIRVRFADVTHVLFGVIIPTEGARCDDDKAIKIYQIISLTFFWAFLSANPLTFLDFYPFYFIIMLMTVITIVFFAASLEHAPANMFAFELQTFWLMLRIFLEILYFLQSFVTTYGDNQRDTRKYAAVLFQGMKRSLRYFMEKLWFHAVISSTMTPSRQLIHKNYHSSSRYRVWNCIIQMETGFFSFCGNITNIE